MDGSRLAATEGLRKAPGRADDAAEQAARTWQAAFIVSTTDSNHALPIAANVLARNFTVARANTVWASDMTYIPTGEGWLYLPVVLHLFSRLPAPGLIFHSDRGIQ